jgi:prepilin-type N-terminal cleavage/methylation domain-containing protein
VLICKHIVPHARRAQPGVTLIELMAALAIGSFLMIGAVTVFMHSRTAFRVTESIARLQENGRFALDAVEPDIRMARYWGLTTRTTKIANRASAADPNGIGNDACGVNWLIDLDHFVQSTNNAYGFGCGARSVAIPNADTLVVRHAAENAVPASSLTVNTMYVQTSRFQDGRIFNDGVLPPGFAAADSETHALIVNGYYVDRDSSLGANFPSLRVKTLLTTGAIQDQEVLPGVEDMQIQLGVDTDVVGAANRGSIDRYVDPDDGIFDPGDAKFVADAEILAVRIWLRLRAERIENGFTDTATYVYADRNAGPFNDGFRRLVVMQTVYLRNARPPS